MNAVSCAFVLVLCALGCSSIPSSPLTEADPTAPSAGPSSGIELGVETTGSNFPSQLKFFVCSDPRTQSNRIELSFLCRFTALASGTVSSNGKSVAGTVAGIWRVGLELPHNCRPNAPVAEFYNYTVVSPALTVARNAFTTMTFSIVCL